MSKQTISPFVNIHLFSPTSLFLEKIFHCHPYCQIIGNYDVFGNGESLNNLSKHTDIV